MSSDVKDIFGKVVYYNSRRLVFIVKITPLHLKTTNIFALIVFSFCTRLIIVVILIYSPHQEKKWNLALSTVQHWLIFK